MEIQPVDPRIVDAITKSLKLKTQLAQLSNSVQLKYEYYNADNDVHDYGISIPKKMIRTRPGCGWAGRAVHTLGDRVVFEGFAGDTQGVNQMFEDTRATYTINKVKDDSLIGGVAFVGIADDEETERKILVPYTAMEATGIVDQTTGLLRYGLAVTRWALPPYKPGQNPGFMPTDYILYDKSYTAIFVSGTPVAIIDNPTNRCLLMPITHRASANRPLGKSRLTNTARRIIQEVLRTKRRQEIAEEFYSTPQRYINGLMEGASKDSSLDSSIGKVWVLTKDEDGEKPVIDQLPQMSIDGFEKSKKDKARDFCAETSLTLRNLGYESGNPSSAESLAAMSDDMLLEAQTCQLEMGQQIKEIAITMHMASMGSDVVPDQLKSITPAWKPIFQVDIAGAGDALYKLFEIMPELAGTPSAYRFLGIGVREAEELAERRRQAQDRLILNGDA